MRARRQNIQSSYNNKYAYVETACFANDLNSWGRLSFNVFYLLSGEIYKLQRLRWRGEATFNVGISRRQREGVTWKITRVVVYAEQFSRAKKLRYRGFVSDGEGGKTYVLVAPVENPRARRFRECEKNKWIQIRRPIQWWVKRFDLWKSDRSVRVIKNIRSENSFVSFVWTEYGIRMTTGQLNC